MTGRTNLLFLKRQPPFLVTQFPSTTVLGAPTLLTPDRREDLSLSPGRGMARMGVLPKHTEPIMWQRELIPAKPGTPRAALPDWYNKKATSSVNDSASIRFHG